MNWLIWHLLESLADGEWHLQPPKGIGTKTVDLCIEYGWVKTKSIPIERKRGTETFFMPLRLTKRGKIVYLIEKSRITGKISKELVEYRLKRLRKLIGAQVVRSLQKGTSVFKEWRRTTPHNWWVENRNGKMLWHSNDQERPDTQMLELVTHSERKIVTGSWLAGADEGKPEESTYQLKKCYCWIFKPYG